MSNGWTNKPIRPGLPGMTNTPVCRFSSDRIFTLILFGASLLHISTLLSSDHASILILSYPLQLSTHLLAIHLCSGRFLTWNSLHTAALRDGPTSNEEWPTLLPLFTRSHKDSRQNKNEKRWRLSMQTWGCAQPICIAPQHEATEENPVKMQSAQLLDQGRGQCLLTSLTVSQHLWCWNTADTNSAKQYARPAYSPHQKH